MKMKDLNPVTESDWQEIINKNLNLIFGLLLVIINLPKGGIKLLLIISSVFTHVKNLFPCFLTFWSTNEYFNPYLPIIFVILVCSLNATTGM